MLDPGLVVRPVGADIRQRPCGAKLTNQLRSLILPMIDVGDGTQSIGNAWTRPFRSRGRPAAAAAIEPARGLAHRPCAFRGSSLARSLFV